MQLRPRVVYTRSKVQQDVEKILELYRRKGRFAARVDPKVIELPQNRVDVVFEISEGSPTYVRTINFVGNDGFNDTYNDWPTFEFTPPASTTKVELVALISGHGQATGNCAWGDDGSTLYMTSHMYLARVKTKTRGAGF